MKTFNLPDLGEGLQEAEIVAWHVAVGDNVVADQPLVSVETDKAVVDVPAPFSGKIAKLCAEAGTAVPVGSPLADFDDGTEAKREDTGTVAGALPTAETASPENGKARDMASQPAGRSGHRIKATPGVRRLAHELDIDLREPLGKAQVIHQHTVAIGHRGEQLAQAREWWRAHRDKAPNAMTTSAPCSCCSKNGPSSSGER